MHPIFKLLFGSQFTVWRRVRLERELAARELVADLIVVLAVVLESEAEAVLAVNPGDVIDELQSVVVVLIGTVAAVADSPRVMSEGNWRLGVFIDAAATDAQAEKLGEVFSGALGGPMEALGPLVGEHLGVERAPIEVREDGLRHSVRIGDAVDFEIEDVVPFGVESGEPARLTGIFHPAGSELTVAHATRSKIDAFGIAYEGKAGFSTSEFSWAA